jgi:HK97 gp10 family phage protein
MIGGYWTGVEGAADALVGIATQVARDEVVAEAMLQAAKPVVADMQIRATDLGLYATGQMVESLEAARVTDAGTGEGIVVVEIGPRRGSPHSHLVRFWELGTSRLPARPFMRPTWDEYESVFPTAVTAALRKAYDTVAARFAARAARGGSTWREDMQAAKTKGQFMEALKKMAPMPGD